MEPAHNDRQEHDGAPGPTILEMLNADCWRAVLDHLDINDVVRSERVSRAWREVVRDYLPGVRSFRIGYVTFGFNKMDESGRYTGYRRIKLNKNNLLSTKGMFEKMGRYIESMASDSIDECWLSVISKTCPNLRDITIDDLFLNVLVNREQLIEELIINYPDHVFGDFLKYLRPNKLRTLHLNKCSFKIENMLDALDNLTGLETLELNDNSPEILRKLHLCLEKFPKLEHLSLNGYMKMDMGDHLIAAIGGLGRLKHLSLEGNRNVDDTWLATVATGCQELRVLDIGDCEDVSGRAIAALASARAPTLAGLGLRGNPHVSDADLAACISHYRNLTWLDVSRCARVSVGIVRAAGGGRRARPLRLRMSRTAAQHEQVQHAGVVIEWDYNDAPVLASPNRPNRPNRPNPYYSYSEDEYDNYDWYDEPLSSKDVDFWSSSS